MNKIHTPKPPTAEELLVMKKQHELERQERLLTYNNRIVEAKLVYYKGTIASAGTDSYTNKQFADIKSNWNSVIMIGTERQRAADNTIDNITGTYSYNLTDEMLKEYEANDKQLLII
tara:strand:- start:291 stop:641 length:351 start_codon:yes stop_codon:yes gene_type:complete